MIPGPLDSRVLLASCLAMRGCHGLRLRRALLPKIDREHYHRPDRQELALPVLERLEPETWRHKVLEHRNRTRAVLHLLLAVRLGATDGVHGKGEHKEGKEGYAQRVLVEL